MCLHPDKGEWGHLHPAVGSALSEHLAFVWKVPISRKLRTKAGGYKFGANPDKRKRKIKQG